MGGCLVTSEEKEGVQRRKRRTVKRECRERVTIRR